MVMLAQLYKNPLKKLNIQLGKENKKYKSTGQSIKYEFSAKYPEANLSNISSDNKLGVMYFVLFG